MTINLSGRNQSILRLFFHGNNHQGKVAFFIGRVHFCLLSNQIAGFFDHQYLRKESCDIFIILSFFFNDSVTSFSKLCGGLFSYDLLMCTAQKTKFSIKDFFSKCDQIRRKMRIWSHLLKKSLMENLIFCAVKIEGLQLVTLFKERLQYRCSLVSFEKFFRTNVFAEQLRATAIVTIFLLLS